ncbi:hypothetical protein ES332_D09G253500v1 [Gossypium tomentosum]|uniref:Uncharacterized protein n=1 Tax=Gossypium tomentosum TaxID=34277 RepID=A0A5D2JMT1_GOSTO|nr:hypothetical protein ES332_D09G253500v1 [Gossypium tomentosum]
MLSMANINPGREGHLGIIVVKSAGDQSGLKDAISWSHIQPLTLGKEGYMISLMKMNERTGEKKKDLLWNLGTVADPNKVDFDMRKRAVIENQRVVNSGQHRKVQLFNPVNNWSIDFYQKKTGP